MSEASIYVFLDRRHDAATAYAAPLRVVTWRGQVDWPGAPRKDDTWFHCGDWAGETVDRVGFCGPEDGRTHMSIEVRTTPEVLVHLRDEHGFSDE
jgi:hypothetical protein